MDYGLIKSVHMLTALISIAGFILRGVWVQMGSPLSSAKLTKILPHVNDTVLLISAIMLAVMAGFSPFEQYWLAAKIVLLVAYIVLGAKALKAEKSDPKRFPFFTMAVICFLAIGYLASAKPF